MTEEQTVKTDNGKLVITRLEDGRFEVRTYGYVRGYDTYMPMSRDVYEEDRMLNYGLKSTMTDELQKEIKQAIEYYGTENQSTVCMEECAELIQAISKIKRYGMTKDLQENLIEEMADVTICLELLKQMYGIDVLSLKDFIQRKTDRLKSRIEQMMSGRKKTMTNEDFEFAKSQITKYVEDLISFNKILLNEIKDKENRILQLEAKVIELGGEIK